MEFLVFSDLHLHNYSYSKVTESGDNELCKAGISIIKQVHSYALKNHILDIYFLGDLFHVRAKLDPDLYCNKVYDIFESLFNSGNINLHLLVGNHDQLDKSGNHILSPLSKFNNVNLIGKHRIIDNILLHAHSYDINTLYSFLKDNSNENSIVMLHQLFINSPTLSGYLFKKGEAIDPRQFKYKAIFSGHNHQPFMNKERRVYNVGSPMHHDFRDAPIQDRFFIHYKDGEVKWVKTLFPKFAIVGVNDEGATYKKNKPKTVNIKESRLDITLTSSSEQYLSEYCKEKIKTDTDNFEDYIKEGRRLLVEV